MSAKFLDLQKKAMEVLLDKVYIRAQAELKNNKFSFTEPYAYFGMNHEHDTYAYDLLIKEGFVVDHNVDCKCDKDEDNCQCPLNGLYVSFLPEYTKDVKAKPDQPKPDKKSE